MDSTPIVKTANDGDESIPKLEQVLLKSKLKLRELQGSFHLKENSNGVADIELPKADLINFESPLVEIEHGNHNYEFNFKLKDGSKTNIPFRDNRTSTTNFERQVD